ncbi:MAG: hypothetical protein KME35_19430 [Aphanocapsa sp. GSE-SYN-MK-11-07L]|nr:hypothetical protein [Aphanocapsa sp. GSE-SYN-MK-11-07L]
MSFSPASLNRACWAIALSLAWHPLAANAFPLTWTLNNVKFTDGATATGNFDFDADSSDYTNINIIINGGTVPNFPYPLTFTDADLVVGVPFLLSLCNPDCDGVIFVFDDLLTNAGGSVGIDSSSSAYGNPGQPDPVLVLSGGSVTAVPVPAAWTGAIAFAALTTRKLKHRQQSVPEQKQ